MSVPSWCRVGAECVCVDASPSYINGATLVKGRRYFIEAVHDTLSGVGLVLRGAPDSGFWLDGGWNVCRFRPPVAKKTMAEDVALIKSHLKAPPRSATKQRERADA